MFIVLLGNLESLGNNIPQKLEMGSRLAVAAWLISMVVIVYGYTCVMAALLTVPKLEPTINTLSELALDKSYRITLEKENLITEQIMVFKIITFFHNKKMDNEIFLFFLL